MAQRLSTASLAVETRLDALFGTGWVPPQAARQPPVSDGAQSSPDRPPPEPMDRAEPGVGRAIRWRIDPGRRAAAALVAVVGLTAAVVGWRVLADRPRAEALADSSAVSVSAPGGASAGRSSVSGSSSVGPTPTAVVVDVVGKVRRPGIVRLSAGSRVNDALRAAGGALPGTDLSTVNLARMCVDGEQIAIGRPGLAASTAPGAPGASVVPGGSGTGAAINLNTATAEQLDALPGVGPVMAQRILDWRTSHGAFASVDQLKQVSGIGDAKYADISPLVSV